MISFIYPFIQRILSGLVSYFGYSKKFVGLWAISVVMMLYPLLSFGIDHIGLSVLFMVVNVIVIFMKGISFDRVAFTQLDKYKDIHLWENLVTGGYFLYLILIGYNILLLVCSVYPALLIHKGLINLGNKLHFFAETTDDPTGKTYSIPLLGIKIRRSNTQFRVVATIGSIVAAIVIYSSNIAIGLHLF